jgi:hypothetical protein
VPELGFNCRRSSDGRRCITWVSVRFTNMSQGFCGWRLAGAPFPLILERRNLPALVEISAFPRRVDGGLLERRRAV